MYLKELKASIVCLQDTHWTDKDLMKVREMWGNNCYINGCKTNSRGVAVLFNDNFEYEVMSSIMDKERNYICLNFKTSAASFNLVSLYAPNTDSPGFFTEIKTSLQKFKADYSIICGDFNLVLDPLKDTCNYKQVNNPKARQAVMNMCNELELLDIYRHFHPEERRYTWRKRNPLKQARLDFFLVSNEMTDLTQGCNIRAGYRSDHSIIKMDIEINKFTIGKGVWKFNNSLLKNLEFVNLINNIIKEEVTRYAAPVYSTAFLQHNSEDIVLRIDNDLFLELLFLRIRGESIKFASNLKKQTNLKEKELMKDIEFLESTNNHLNVNLQLLSDKKIELESIRSNRVKGEAIRSRTQWLTEGESPSRYFCNLEKRNFVEKTIRKLQTNTGNYVSDQKEIMNHVQKFYANLFRSRESELEQVDLERLLTGAKIKKIKDLDLGTPLTTNELEKVLKRMKNNKTPGMDGLSSKFLKVFWSRLKFFITKALNSCFEKGILSTTLRTCIINCIPKGSKNRSSLKNWRPISLLCVTYKLASGVIADRLKSTLDQVVSESQTGFIPGRQISDNTRLIYDIMHISEVKNISGLLMLIDFEKAFDSISWKFLYKVLSFFGYNKDFIKWIQLFNTDIHAYVLQCGNLSRKILIERGCRQGDPLSPYLFLIGAEVLSLLIKINPGIVGFVLNNKEFKVTQFADDTTLILDGTKNSLQSALNTIETFGNFSGLKMNKEKTKVIWIGRKKYSKEKLNVSEILDWGKCEFTLLGIEFSVNLSNMPEMNYNKALIEIRKDILKWQNRNLTPFGKITVIKTLLLSKYIHLFTSIPTPKGCIKQVNDVLFKFLWNKKPDKVKRKTVCLDYLEGGLKMINIHQFAQALKLTWVRRIFFDSTSQWHILLAETYQKLNNLWTMGGEWSKIILKSGKNPFWSEIFTIWQMFFRNLEVSSNLEITQTCLWYNSQLSKESICFPKWYQHHIYVVGDIIDTDGKVMKVEDIKSKYNFNPNILDYYRVKKLMERFINKNKKGGKFETFRPTYPCHLKFLGKPTKGCKQFYQILKDSCTNTPLCKLKWNKVVSPLDNLNNVWVQIFKACFKSVTDNTLVWFQYKILFNILDTRGYLHKVKIIENNQCYFCKQDTESITHLFSKCPVVVDFWKNVSNWITRRLHLHIQFSESMKILGYHIQDENFWPINFVLLLSRWYIYQCSRKETYLNIFFFQTQMKKKYLEEKYIWETKLSLEAFKSRWLIWEKLFEGI